LQQFEPARNGRYLGGDEDGDAAGHDHQYRTDEHDGQVIAQFADKGARANAPDVVKGIFDIAQHLDHCPEEDNDADAGDHSPLGVVEHVLGESDDLGDHFLLGGKFIQQLLLESPLESEPFGDTKCHSGDRYQGQQRKKGQRRCAQGALMPGKAPDRQNQRSHQPDQQPLDGRSFTTAGMPYGGGEKSDDGFQRRPDFFHKSLPVLGL
jgi:hypothetical protein